MRRYLGTLFRAAVEFQAGPVSRFRYVVYRNP